MKSETFLLDRYEHKYQTRRYKYNGTQRVVANTLLCTLQHQC